jgi:hypothetical protein
VRDSEIIEKRAKKVIKGVALASLGVAGTYYGIIFFGIMDYLYQPECFRAGERPEPSAEAAPGRAEVVPRQAGTADGNRVVSLRFTAGEGGISEDGGIKVGPCDLVDFPDGRRKADYPSPFGWGILQNTRPARPNYFTVELDSRGHARLEVERKPSLPIRFGLRVAAREWMRRRGGDFKRLDYANLLLEQSKIKIRVRGGRLSQGDEVVVTMGDKHHGGGGWIIPANPAHSEFLVEVDERALGRYRLIEELPALDVVGKPADLHELNSSSPGNCKK